MPSATRATSMSFRGRSVLSLRRNQVVSMDQVNEDELPGLDLFQSHVADCLLSLDTTNQKQQLPSLPFLQKLMDAFLSCDDEFKNLLLKQNPAILSKPPVDRFLSELVDRAVKSLDVCNEITESLQLVCHWNRHADIAAMSAVAGEGSQQLIRARRALAKLLQPWPSLSKTSPNSMAPANLVPPKGGGLALAVYTMSSVLVLLTWVLAVAFSESGSGSTPVVAPPRQLAWGPAVIGIQERIGEEWRKRGRTKGGVLVELVEVERCGRELKEAEGAEDVAGRGKELEEASQRLEEGLGPFERQMREVFHRTVKSREEVLRCLEQTAKASPPFIVL